MLVTDRVRHHVGAARFFCLLAPAQWCVGQTVLQATFNPAKLRFSSEHKYWNPGSGTFREAGNQSGNECEYVFVEEIVH